MLWWLQWRARALRVAILDATEKREAAMVAAGQLNAWISRAQSRLAALNGTIASIEDPKKLIEHATSQPL